MSSRVRLPRVVRCSWDGLWMVVDVDGRVVANRFVSKVDARAWLNASGLIDGWLRRTRFLGKEFA